MSETTFHCDLAWLGGESTTADRAVTIVVSDGVIVRISVGSAPPPTAVHLAGVTLPGLANAHSHAFHRVLRGRTHTGSGSFWTWREQMYAVAAGLTPHEYYALARAVYGEMVLAGITAVGEFHYLHHGPAGVSYEDPNAMGRALIAAAGDAGLRITLLDTCYLHGGIGPTDAPVAPNEVQQRFSDGSGEQWAQRVSDLAASLVAADGRVRIGAAIHSVRAVDPQAIEVVARWAAEHDAPLHAHVSEQPAENDDCLAAHGVTPTQLLADHGALSDRFTAVHGTHLTPADIATYGSHGCAVCFCPTTERDLADGIGPSAALVRAGVALSLGSDSHAVIDPFEEMRATELNERLATRVRGSHSALSLLRAATVAGHRCLGWPGSGVLAVGAPADFISVGLDSVRMAGTPDGAVLESVVFAATAGDVHHVVVAGEVIVRDGRHLRIDVPAELARTVGAW